MEQSREIIRHLLGSIDLSDVAEDEDMTEEDYTQYIATISAAWPRLEKDIKKLLYAQLMFTSNESANWDQVLFGRGTFNGLDLLREKWEKAHNEHMARSIPTEEFDEHAPIGEIGE